MSFKHPATILGNHHYEKLKHLQQTKDDILNKGLDDLRKSTPLDYKTSLIANLNIGPYGQGGGHKEFIGDCMQMLQQTLMYVITMNENYARKAIDIIRIWCDGCQSFKGLNAPLECGWGGTLITRAVEILKYKYPNWNKSFVEQKFQGFLDRIIVPNLQARYREIFKYNNNWTATIIECFMQIALFRDDKNTFDWCISEYKKLLNSCVFPSGKHTETTRDLIHAQFLLGGLVQIPEMCWHQGVDLYKENNEILCKCMEYHAFILNKGIPKDVKKEELKDIWFMSCVWDMSYHHYNKIKKRNMPECQKLLTKRRPEKLVFNWGPSFLWYNLETSPPLPQKPSPLPQKPSPLPQKPSPPPPQKPSPPPQKPSPPPQKPSPSPQKPNINITNTTVEKWTQDDMTYYKQNVVFKSSDNKNLNGIRFKIVNANLTQCWNMEKLDHQLYKIPDWVKTTFECGYITKQKSGNVVIE